MANNDYLYLIIGASVFTVTKSHNIHEYMHECPDF